jgi:diacylglycerol kinase (ATP)
MPFAEPSYVIANPVAGQGKAARMARKMAGVHYTQYPGHASELALAALQAGHRRIAIVGGDGTLHEAIQKLVGVAPPDFEILFLGGGTSCDFARRPHSPQPTDILRIDCRDAQGRPVTRYAVNGSHIGMVAQAAGHYNHPGPLTRAAKWLATDPGMLAAALSAIISHRPFAAEVSVDGSPAIGMRLSNTMTFKTPWIGGGMHLGVPSSCDDGLLGLLLAEPCNGREFLGLIRAAYRGSLARHAKCRLLRCQQVCVHPAIKLEVESDGELAGWTPVRYSVVPRALRM